MCFIYLDFYLFKYTFHPREPEETSGPASERVPAKGKGKGKGKSLRDLELAKTTTAEKSSTRGEKEAAAREGNTSRSSQKRTPRKGGNDGEGQTGGEAIPQKHEF